MRTGGVREKLIFLHGQSLNGPSERNETERKNIFSNTKKRERSTNQNLIQINLPEGISSIGRSAFYNSSNLETIFIPKTITLIEKYAFWGCFNLKSIYCQAINPPKLGSWTFIHIPKNSKIYVPMESVDAYRQAYGWEKYADKIVGYDF